MPTRRKPRRVGQPLAAMILRRSKSEQGGQLARVYELVRTTSLGERSPLILEGTVPPL